MEVKNIINLLFKELNVFYKDYKEEIVPNSDGYIHEFSKNENSIKILFDPIHLKALNVSENLEELSGHSVQDFRKSTISSFLSFIVLEHLTFPYVWANWISTIYKYCGMPYDAVYSFCGVKVKHKDGRVMRIMLRMSGLEFLDNGAAKVLIISIDDITHLMRADFYWGRMIFGKEEKRMHHLISTDKKDVPQDIISEREKDVLRLIARGMESKEIGKELFISSHTVDNHRRNMIARTGVRDTTALVQVCRMAGII